MDKDIIKLVDKVFDVYSKTKLSLVNKKELVDKVLTYKNRFNPNKGSFNGYFGTVTKSCMLSLYKNEEERIKLVMSRNEKINQILND